MPRALIFGASGQDGPYLATFLADKGYVVIGCCAPWDPCTEEARTREPRMKMVTGDLLDPSMPLRLLNSVEPDEIYNLAALTFVPASWDQPMLVSESNGMAVLGLLEAIYQLRLKAKFYQAGTSEMFGSYPPPQSEETPMRPVSPYAAAKLFAHHACRIYRESHGLFAVSGILFNHESPWRGTDFVTRHVSLTLAKIRGGLTDSLPLGNLAAVRDWGHAQDYVRAMWLMLQQNEPEDFVIGTGMGRTVRDFAFAACAEAGVSQTVIQANVEERMRPIETADLVANPQRAREVLGWEPEITFTELISEMVRADMDRLGCES